MTGRTAELKYLNDFYDKNGSQLLVLYGQKHIGKTLLLREFAGDKACSYYLAGNCSEREHLICFCREASGFTWNGEDGFGAALERIPAVSSKRKRVIILDEFQNMVKVSQSFMRELVFFVQTRKPGEEVLVILTSSSVGWVENSMISRIGKAAHALSGLYKIKQLSFVHLKEYFPGFDDRQCVEAYAILGGVPGLWKYFDDSLSIKENICKNILDSSAFLHGEAERCTGEELRETGVYHTILAALSSGRRKLNELYLYTGFSRAKISVYLKHLMERELVEKVFSFESDGRNNTKKGVYRISNHFVDFYFTFLHPGIGRLFSMSAEQYYEAYIAPGFKRYTEEYYKKVCRQYIGELSRTGVFPDSFEKIGEWAGKTGDIDIIAQDENKKTLIGQCSWEDSFFGVDRYRRLLSCAEKAKVKPDRICLFSSGSFEERIMREAEHNKNLLLFGPDKL